MSKGGKRIEKQGLSHFFIDVRKCSAIVKQHARHKGFFVFSLCFPRLSFKDKTFGQKKLVLTLTQKLLVDSLRTALILGCEFGCKDAVEVLLKSGADVKAVDSVGHDAFHYARFSKNPELVAMVKSYIDKANRGQNVRES